MSFGVGSGYPPTSGRNTKGEFRDMIMEILDGAIGSTFVPTSRKALKTNAKRRGPILPIPLQTLVVLLWLLRLDTHGARIPLTAWGVLLKNVHGKLVD